ncbi:MAG: Gfo/Idh/MocA family oxidoreductase [Candidatus Sulfotelmatobacter sp.]
MPASRTKKKSIAENKSVTNKTGFAVIGLGSIAQSSILPAFAKCKYAKLVAVVGRDAQKTSRLARKFKVNFQYHSDNFAACLANPEVSAVYIATPQGEHERLTIQSAEAGKHVLCEKPLATTRAQSAAMVEACRRDGVLLMTAYRKYYEPSTLYLKQLIKSGKLGRIDVIHTAFSELHTPGKSLPWLLNAKMAGGGPLMDLGVYCVNTSRWLVDEDPIEANAEAWVHDRARFREVEEGVSFRLRFPSGLLVQGSSSYGAAPSSFLYVQGTAGWASLSPAFPFEEERKLTAKIVKRHIVRTFPLVDEFAPEIDAFASAIQKHGSVEPDGVQGHKDMIILDAIYKSAREKKPVAISY